MSLYIYLSFTPLASAMIPTYCLSSGEIPASDSLRSGAASSDEIDNEVRDEAEQGIEGLKEENPRLKSVNGRN